MGKIHDKTGREIMAGDILKVFHYIAALRRKRCYMYKQALGIVTIGKGASDWMKINHLNFNDSDYYHEQADGRVLQDYEIVQSIDAKFEDRPRINTNQ